MRQSIPRGTNIRVIIGNYAGPGREGTVSQKPVAYPDEYAHGLQVTLDGGMWVTLKRDQSKPGGGFKW